MAPHVDFDPGRAVANTRRVNPSISTLSLSARTGEGLDRWCDWLRGELTRVHERAFA